MSACPRRSSVCISSPLSVCCFSAPARCSKFITRSRGEDVCITPDRPTTSLRTTWGGAGAREIITAPAIDFATRLDADIEASGGEVPPDPSRDGAIGATMFDLPGSEDGTSPCCCRRTSCSGRRRRRWCASRAATAPLSGHGHGGPFAEPDSLRGDSHMLVTVATRGGIYLPPYHGRVQVTILGEEQEDGTLGPPRAAAAAQQPRVHG